MKKLKTLFYIAGIYSIGSVSYDFSKGIYNHYYRPPKNLQDLYGKGYALITQSNDEVGQEFAKQLAEKGFNLILLSDKTEELEKLKNEIQQINANVDIRIHEYNPNTDPKDLDIQNLKILKQIFGFHISLFIDNNRYYAESKEKICDQSELDKLLNINCISSTLLYKDLLQLRKVNDHKMAYLNINSQRSDREDNTKDINLAFQTYRTQFIRSLIQERTQNNIDLYSVQLGFLNTKEEQNIYKGLLKTFLGELLTEEPYYAVYNVINSLGYDKEIWGSERHAFMHYLLRLQPYLSGIILGS